jgi:hypothetical protein
MRDRNLEILTTVTVVKKFTNRHVHVMRDLYVELYSRSCSNSRSCNSLFLSFFVLGIWLQYADSYGNQASREYR